MKTFVRQRGFIHIPKGALEALFAFAIVGVVAVLGIAVGTLIWLMNHLAFV